jgi:hypothetical protein
LCTGASISFIVDGSGSSPVFSSSSRCSRALRVQLGAKSRSVKTYHSAVALSPAKAFPTVAVLP